MNDTARLPATTASGENTFGCLVDGALFLPDPLPNSHSGVYAELQFYKNVTGVTIYVDDFSGQRALVIFLYNPGALMEDKTYDLADPDFFVQYIDFTKPPACAYRSVVSGEIRIGKCQLDRGSPKIIAGTFELSVSSEDCGDVVAVTQGRFDIGEFRE